MYFKFECPNCDRSLKINSEMAGKRRACPYCRHAFVMPAGPEAASKPENALPSINVNAGPSSSKPSAARVKQTGVASQTGREPTGQGATGQGATGQGATGQGAIQSPSQSSSMSDHSSDGSNVSLTKSGLIGLGCAVLLFAGLYVLAVADIRIGRMFWDSYEINFPTTLLMFWSFAILVLKSRQLARQRSAMLMDLLPTEISREITLDSLDKFVSHIHSLPSNARQSILVNRVLRGIEHFRVRKSAAETVTMMESQSAIDAANVAGSYTIIKVFIWAMPILGFIGTVMGVSSAIAGLSATLESASDVSAITNSMKGVFGGLGTAFDTTLLALVMSLIVKIPTSALQKSEDGLVTIADEYCNENLLRRLNDGREGGAERGLGGQGADTRVFREAVEAAMGTHHAELENWLKKLDSIGSKLTNQVAEGWSTINQRIQQQQQQQLTQFQKQTTDQASQLQSQLDEMNSAALGIQKTLTELNSQAAAMQREVTTSVGSSTSALEKHFGAIESGLSSLSRVLESLGEQQVVVQQVEPERRGWFGRSKRKGPG